MLGRPPPQKSPIMPDISPPPSRENVARSLPPRVGLPLIGALPPLLPNPLRYIMEAREKHGDIYTLDIGFRNVIMLNHPRHAQHVLRDNPRAYGKGGPIWDSIRKIIGDGLPTTDGDFWLRQRRMMQPHFHRERLAKLLDLITDAVDGSMDVFEKAANSQAPIDVYHAFSHMTMNVVVQALFGADISKQTAEEVSVEFDYAVKHILASLVTHSLPQWMPVPGRKRFDDAVRLMDKVIYDLIARRRSRGTDAGGDLLGMLIDSVDADTGSGMTDRQVRDEALALLLAGYETTSTALAFAAANIASDPKIANSLNEEFSTVLGQERPALAHLARMPLSNMVLQESMRLHPPSYWIVRKSLQEDSIDGYHIPAGMVVGVVVYVIQRHPEQWDNPDAFDPWRFTPERSVGRHPLAWLPFGSGQRQCIGKEFAIMEGQIALARVLTRYELEPVPERPVKPEFAATIRPYRGAWLRLRRRAPRPANVAVAG